jgi:hypothetical protein
MINRRRADARRQLGQQLDSVHPGHAHVEQQAGVGDRAIALEEVGGRRKRLDREAFGLEHGLERFADRILIVHHDDGGLREHGSQLTAA